MPIQTELFNKVNQALEDIRPHLAVDGGNIELIEITEDLTVRVKWLGNCESCNMSVFTMKAGLEQAVCSKVPQIKSVTAVNGVMVS